MAIRVRARPASSTERAAADARWRVPLSDLEVDAEIEEAALEAIRSGWWSMGPRVEAFEADFAAYCGSAHAIAVSSGTAALHLALLGVGCAPGDEVLLTSLNFVAAANVIRHTGATPVFCDITGPTDLNVSPDDLEAAVTPATRAIVLLHYGGHPGPVDEVLRVAARHGLVVVEDAAHAPGATWRSQKCGTFGAAGCFSFFSNKNLPIGEGGMVVTDDRDVAARIRLLRSHGMTSLTWDRHRGHAHDYDVVAGGFNYRMDELRAAVARVQLARLDERNARRARIAASYRDALHGAGGLTLPFGPGRNLTSAHHLAVAVLPPGRDRNAFRTALAVRGIQTSMHYPPIHRFSSYRDLGRRRPLPVTDEVARRLVTLPLYPSMREDDVFAVVNAVLAEV